MNCFRTLFVRKYIFVSSVRKRQHANLFRQISRLCRISSLKLYFRLFPFSDISIVYNVHNLCFIMKRRQRRPVLEINQAQSVSHGEHIQSK